MKEVRFDAGLAHLVEKMACAYGVTRCEAFLALWEADEIVVVDGLVRLIIPTRPDGRIAW